MRRWTIAFAVAWVALRAAGAEAVPVASFAGDYDEATGAEAAGDYDNIGGAADVGDFALVAGVNSFRGSVVTGGLSPDSSDVFNLVVGANQTLVGASIVFAENATPFNPLFAAPPPQWTLQESTTTPVIFDLALGPNGATGPQTFTAPSFTRGPGTYNVLIGNGTFALNDASPVDYTMTFDVIETIVDVSEPTTLALVLGGVGLMLWAGWRQRWTNAPTR